MFFLLYVNWCTKLGYPWNANIICLSFVNKYDEETLQIYPFKYQFKVDYILDENKLTTKVTVTNLGNDVMPFNFGGHPAFNVPLYQGETFEDYSIYFERNFGVKPWKNDRFY